MSIEDSAALAKIREAVTGKSLTDAASELGVSKSGLSNTLTTLRKLGAEIKAKRSPGGGGAKPKFDTVVAERLFAAGVSHVDIAKHVGSKPANVSRYLEKIGKKTKPVPLDEALAKLGLADPVGEPVQVAA